jgi:hypothetical protein
MDGAAIVRLRWRLHGAWMWPAFLVLSLADGAIGHWLPPTGDSWSPVGAFLLCFFFGLVSIAVLAPLFGMLLRRVRGDMPKVVARDYAGTSILLLITVLMLTAGLLHHAQISADQRTMEDATARAEAYIGVHAPSRFRNDMQHLSTYVVQPGAIYRTCVRDLHSRSWCVIVNAHEQFSRSVRFAGSEPNSLFSQGAW